MEDLSKYFKYAMMLPIIVAFFVSIILIAILQSRGYNITYSSNTFTYGKSQCVWPTPNFYGISSYFGRRNSPTAGASSYHEGVDILANQGTKVLSIADGKVIFSGWSSSGGYMIKIQHDNGLVSAYCHLDEELYVEKDEYVYAGQSIGAVGPKYISNGKLNGATTGVHLHLAIYQNR